LPRYVTIIFSKRRLLFGQDGHDKQTLMENGGKIRVKVKVNFTLRTGGEGPEGEQWYSSTFFLTSVLDGDEWSRSRTGHFTPGKETRCIGPRAGLDGCGKCRPHRDSIAGPSRP
jgi:hypothetical protein